MQERAHRKAFFGWVLVVFLAELFSPFALAQAAGNPSVTPTPSPEAPAGSNLNPISPAASAPASPAAAGEQQQIGICTISAFTPDEAQRFMDAVFNFQGKQLTDKSDSKLAAGAGNASGGPTVVTNVYNFQSDQSQYLMTVADAAQVMGRSAKSVADELGVNESEYVSAAQVASLASSDPNKESILSKLKNFKGGKAVSGPGFEEMKVRLPNGLDVPLSDIYKLKAIHEQKRTGDLQQDCLLDSAHIKGKVTYAALLDQDLLIGSDLSNKTEADPQHIRTDAIRASLTNFDGNIVIPSMYEKAVGEMGHWISADILISGALAVNSIFTKQNAQTLADNTQKQLDSLAVQKSNLLVAQSQASPARTHLGNGLSAAWERAVAQQGLGFRNLLRLDDIPEGENAMFRFLKVKSGNGADAAALESVVATARANGINPVELRAALQAGNAEGDQRVRDLIRGAWGSQSSPENQRILLSRLTFDEKDMDQLFDPQTGAALGTAIGGVDVTGLGFTVQDIQRSYLSEADSKLLTLEATSSGLIQRQEKVLQEDLHYANIFSNYGFKRVWTNTVMGLLWLGPGRVGLELAGNIAMASWGPAKGTNGDYLRIFAGNSDVAKAFRQGTDFLLMGSFLSAVSEYLPVSMPSKVYWVGNVIFIQSPVGEGKESYLTTIAREDAGWLVNTQWQGEVSATAFEDVRDNKATTSMAVQTNNLRLSGGMLRKKELSGYYRVLETLAPLLAWKLLQGGDAALRPIATILQLNLLQIYIENIVDPSKFSPDEACSEEKLNSFIGWYKTAMVATTVEQVALFSSFPPLAWQRYLEGLKVLGTPVVGPFKRLVTVVDPIELYKQHRASLVFNYALSCKDPSYKILAYQKIPQESKKSNVLKSIADKTSNPLSSLAKGLNIGEAFAGLGKSVSAAELKEILDAKVLLDNQQGMLRPAELYYFHLDPESADIAWFNTYDKNYCFRQCLQQSDGSAICIDGEKGVYKQNPDGTRTYLADADHALSSIFIPGLGTVVPNKLISASLDCGSSPIMEASGSGALRVVDASCPAMDCALKALASVSKKQVGADLTSVLGKVEFISTTVGFGNPVDNEFRFTRKAGVKVTDQKTVLGIPRPGTNTQIKPEAQGVNGSGLLHKEESLVGTERRFSSIEVLGNGKARVAGGTAAEDDLGTLQTISFERGAIHYDATRGKLFIALRVLADVPARDITGISAAPSMTSDAKADYSALQKQLADLLAKIAAGQKLSADELELLKGILSKPTPSSASLTSKEKETYKEALAKQAQGKPLTPDEQAVVDKVVKAEKSPGIIVLPPEKIERIEKLMRDEGLAASLVDALRDKMRDGTPLTKAEKDTVTQALDKAAKDGSVPQAEADQLKKDVANATSKGAVVDEIANALSGGKALTPEQAAVVQDAVKAEQDRAKQGAASGTGPGPAISLGGVTAKPGAEESAVELNTALKGINPLTDFVTDKNIVSLRKPDAEHPASEFPNGYVRIGDRAAGTFQDLKATGAPVTGADGKSVVVPTEKGDVKVDLSVDKNGQPIITVNAPGVQASSPLIFAQGPNGLLWFDKNTNSWKAMNGMAVPADELFGKNGVSFNGGADGTSGVPSNNRFGQSNVLDTAPSYNPLLALPSWPESPAAAGFVIVVILFGVAFVRRRAWQEGGRQGGQASGERGKQLIASQGNRNRAERGG